MPPKSDEMIAASPSTSVTRLFAPPPKVGARIVPLSLITNTSDCPWWVRSWFTSCSKAEMSAANSWSGSPSRATRGSSRSKPHLKSQATGVSRPPDPGRIRIGFSSIVVMP